MAVIVTEGALADVQPTWWPINRFGSVRLYDNRNYDYATLYRTQPNVRTCVDFLARNIAQLGLHTFRRVSDTDRLRLTDHPLAVVLGNPLPPEFKVTRYGLMESLMADLGVYYRAYWLKIRSNAGGPLGLLRLPPPFVEVGGGLVPTTYKLNLIGREPQKIKPLDIVHFRGYNPENPVDGLSPLETLRRILAEEQSSGEYREGFWQNAARMSGIIERPREAPAWSVTARERFKAEFEALYSGGDNSGKTAILEEGMTWRPGTFSPQESEYLLSRKLTREECARAYHIPLPMVGILDNATFSNIREQHKNLYQDSLGPWLAMIEQDIELQVMPEFSDINGVYVEFNIQEKLQGSFEEQTEALRAAVGRPWMTANEVRARMNLPRLGGDADLLVTPLNVLVGGQASPQDVQTAARLPAPVKKDAGLDTNAPELRARHEAKWREILVRHYKRQEAAILTRIGKAAKTVIGDIWWDDERWDSELTEDLLRLNVLTAGEWASMFADRLGAEVSEERMLPWLQEHSRIQATYINQFTRGRVEAALNDPEPQDAVKQVFAQAISVWALREAISSVTSALNFGATEAANSANLATKTWRVNSGNPRPLHASIDGETVGIRGLFSNGMKWPGDPVGGVENNAGCQCSVEFGR